MILLINRSVLMFYFELWNACSFVARGANG